VIEPGGRAVLIDGAAVRIHVGDYEVHAVRSVFAIHKSQRRRIRIIRAIDAPDRIAPDRELIGVRLTLVGPPAAAVIGGGRFAAVWAAVWPNLNAVRGKNVEIFFDPTNSVCPESPTTGERQ